MHDEADFTIPLHLLKLISPRIERIWLLESRRVKKHVERAREKGVPATLTLEEWLQICCLFEWKCVFCSKPMEGMEHLEPISDGGGTTRMNCLPCCVACNNLRNQWHIATGQAMATLARMNGGCFDG